MIALFWASLGFVLALPLAAWVEHRSWTRYARELESINDDLLQAYQDLILEIPEALDLDPHQTANWRSVTDSLYRNLTSTP